MTGSAHPEGSSGKPRRPREASGEPPEDRYDPSKVEATRERHQGLGMGERDLERQRDPHRPAPPPDENGRPDGE